MSQPPSLGVGMVGYAFMGRAHSQAWRTVDRVFELPLRPRLAAICGRDQAATAAAAAPAGLGGGRDRLARAHRPRRRAADRHRRPGRPARADRDRRPAGGQARAVREAAGEHAGRGRADGGRGRRRVPERRARHGRVQLPPGAGRGAGPAAGRAGPDRDAAARPGGVPAGLAGRPRLAADLADAGRAGRLRRARRPRRAHRRPRPLPDRGRDRGRVGRQRDLRARSARCSTARARAGSRSTTRWCSAPGSGPARWARSRRPGTPPGARTGCGSSSTARPAASRSTSSGSTSSSSTTATTPTAARPPGSAGSWSPSRNIPTSPAGGRPVTPSAGSTRSPTRPGTC